MYRAHLPTSLRSYRPLRLPKQNGLRSVSRNVSSALRPLNLNVPLVSPRGVVRRVQPLRWNASINKASECDESSLKRQTSTEDIAPVNQELQEKDEPSSGDPARSPPSTTEEGVRPGRQELQHEDESLFEHLDSSQPISVEEGVSSVNQKLEEQGESSLAQASSITPETAEEGVSPPDQKLSEDAESSPINVSPNLPETAEDSGIPLNQESMEESISPPENASSRPPGISEERVRHSVTLPISMEGKRRRGTFGAFWLRDNCQCPKCINRETRQRIVDTFSLPEDISVTSFSSRSNGIEVKFSDGHVSTYEHRWLAERQGLNKGILRNRNMPTFRPFRTISPDASFFPTVSYSEVISQDSAVLKWLDQIYIYGFCFVKDTPVNPESTEALLKRIAFIRHTHYGGFWDFTSDLTYKDTAYTDEALGAHTDNTYFTDPARLQLFHLLSHTDGEGGASLLVDGFRAAWSLLQENREHALTLADIRQPYHASGNEDICIQPLQQFPVLNVHPQIQRRLQQVRWNNYDRAVKSDWTPEERDRWYQAARHFDEIIHRPEREIWTQLEPGTALIFDNWRMLHGRSAFTGKRRMCGGYISNDDFLSRYRLLKFGREAVLNNLGNTKRHSKNPYSLF